MNKENCALKLVDEIILYYDARSKKHQIKSNLSVKRASSCSVLFCLHDSGSNFTHTPCIIRYHASQICEISYIIRGIFFWTAEEFVAFQEGVCHLKLLRLSLGKMATYCGMSCCVDWQMFVDIAKDRRGINDPDNKGARIFRWGPILGYVTGHGFYLRKTGLIFQVVHVKFIVSQVPVE